MKKLFSYLENIPLSRKWILAVVLLSIAVVPTLVNLLFISDKLRTFLDNQLYFVGMGVVVYGCWLTLLFFLQKKDPVRPEHLSLTRSEISRGFFLGFGVYVAVSAALFISILIKGEDLALSSKFQTIEGVSKALGVFSFNIFLGAFVEEVLCRVYIIPQFYLVLCKRIKSKVAALLLALVVTQLLFALLHLPRDLFRFDVDTATIISTQLQLFMSGIILSLVYLRTRNVIFLAIFHAFMNYGLPIVGAEADFKLYYMVGAFVLVLFWDRVAWKGRERETLGAELSATKVA